MKFIGDLKSLSANLRQNYNKFYNYKGLVSVCEVSENPYWMKVIDEGWNLKNFIEGGENYSRRQDLPKVYILNGAIYIAKWEVLKKDKSFYERKCIPFVMSKEKSLDIDNPLDFEFAEFLMKWIKRDEKTSNDTVGKIEGIKFTLNKMEEKLKKRYDYVIDLDITSPIRKVGDIEKALEKARNGDCYVVFSVTEASRNPYFNMVEIGNDGFYHTVKKGNFTSRQQAPKVYDMNASIYVYNRKYIDNMTSSIERAKVIVMDRTSDIDSEFDFMFVEYHMKKLLKNNSYFKRIRDNIKNILASNTNVKIEKPVLKRSIKDGML